MAAFFKRGRAFLEHSGSGSSRKKNLTSNRTGERESRGQAERSRVRESRVRESRVRESRVRESRVRIKKQERAEKESKEWWEQTTL